MWHEEVSDEDELSNDLLVRACQDAGTCKLRGSMTLEIRK